MHLANLLHIVLTEKKWHRVPLMLAAMFVLANAGSAQQKQADSLLNKLNSSKLQDSSYLNTLNKISIAYSGTADDKAMMYADQAIALAKKLQNQHAEAEAWFTKEKIYRTNAQAQKAIDAGLIALNSFERLNDLRQAVVCCNDISTDYYSLTDYPTSLQYANRSADIARQIPDDLLLAYALNRAGNCYTMLADYPKAIAVYLQQLKIFEKLKDKSSAAKAYGNIGLVNYYLKKYPAALLYYNKCLKTLESLDDKLWVAAALNNIGAVYLETGDYKKVIDYNTRALQINKILKSKKGMGNDLMDIGAAYSKMSYFSQALRYTQQAVAIYTDLGAKNNLAMALGHLAMLYTNAPADTLRKLKINPDQSFNDALTFQKKAIKLSQETKSVSTEADQWKNLSIIYEKGHKYREALSAYRTYSTLNEGIFNNKKQNEITRLGIQYEFDKKAAVLKADSEKKQAELAKQKVIINAAIVIGTILLLAGIALFILYKRRNDAREKQKEAEFKMQVAESEMKMLRSQLNPHFIFNSLNSIGDYIARHDKETADLYLVRFARLMRIILESSEHETISLADDLKALELYMQLEALRLDHKFLYAIEIDKDIDTELTQVPPMLLQPFVENSIWHGLPEKKGNGYIAIRVKKNGEMIEYIVEDNGIGRERSLELKRNKTTTNTRSFGIKMIQSRINIINKANQTDARVELTDLDEGTKVSIRLPHELKF